jgi:hypothetical protein
MQLSNQTGARELKPSLGDALASAVICAAAIAA